MTPVPTLANRVIRRGAYVGLFPLLRSSSPLTLRDICVTPQATISTAVRTIPGWNTASAP